MFVCDIVDFRWDGQRMRRLKASFLSCHLQSQLTAVFPVASHKLVRGWATRDPQAVQQVNDSLAAVGLTIDIVLARNLKLSIDVAEQIDRLIRNADERRDAALRGLERHRQSLGKVPENDDAVDADYEDVAPQNVEKDVR